MELFENWKMVLTQNTYMHTQKKRRWTLQKQPRILLPLFTRPKWHRYFWFGSLSQMESFRSIFIFGISRVHVRMFFLLSFLLLHMNAISFYFHPSGFVYIFFYSLTIQANSLTYDVIYALWNEMNVSAKSNFSVCFRIRVGEWTRRISKRKSFVCWKFISSSFFILLWFFFSTLANEMGKKQN